MAAFRNSISFNSSVEARYTHLYLHGRQLPNNGCSVLAEIFSFYSNLWALLLLLLLLLLLIVLGHVVGLLGKQTIYVTHFRVVVVAVNQIHGAFLQFLRFLFFIVIIWKCLNPNLWNESGSLCGLFPIVATSTRHLCLLPSPPLSLPLSLSSSIWSSSRSTRGLLRFRFVCGIWMAAESVVLVLRARVFSFILYFLLLRLPRLVLWSNWFKHLTFCAPNWAQVHKDWC